MRRRWPRYLLCCTLAFGWTAGAFASQLPEVSTEEALIALERGWNEAFYARDVEFLESILADDFIVTYDDGARVARPPTAPKCRTCRRATTTPHRWLGSDEPRSYLGFTRVLWDATHCQRPSRTTQTSV